MSGPELEEVVRLKRAGDLDAAVIAVEDALAAHPRHPLALAHLGDIQLRRSRPEEALDALDRAETAGGATGFTCRLRGDIAYKARRWDEAARCYQDADALGDRSTWTLVQLGRARMRLGDLDGAHSAAARAVERDMSFSAGWVLLGDVAGRRDRPDEAEAMYATAHDKAPGDKWAYAKLVEARLTKLAPEERAREIKVLRKTGGDNPHLTAVLARLRSEQGDEQAAADAWRDRAQHHGDLYGRKMHGFALRRAGQPDEAAAVLAACLQDDPQDLVLFRTYVHLQHQRGAIDQLRQTLESLLPLAGSRRGAVYGELRKLPEPAGGAPDLS